MQPCMTELGLLASFLFVCTQNTKGFSRRRRPFVFKARIEFQVGALQNQDHEIMAELLT